MGFTAHIRDDGEIQSVKEHSLNTAVLTGKYLERAGLASCGYLCGLLHDIGKLQKLFDDYINKRSDLSRGSIDHSYAGAKYLVSLAGDNKTKIAAVSMAHTIVSHHGIHDWLDDDNCDYFSERISNDKGYDEIVDNLNEMIGDIKINELFRKAVGEWFDVSNNIRTFSNSKNKEGEIDNIKFYFYLGMLERLIQSALIDADRTDTADFMSGVKTYEDTDTSLLWAEMDKRMDEKLKGFEDKTDAISLQRRSISDRCAAFAEHKVGACRLIVPTGGGKTLSSLRFAIKQCKKFGMKKIFYIAPFMSILEQNSDVIGELADEEYFLEHHSNIISEIDDENELEKYLLYSERWTSPVIATTMVQFLNTLFSAKTSSVRRMHCLCDSVIIIDEVQSVPLKCTHLFSLAVNFLTKICGCSVVLCSATQPTFETNEHSLLLDERADMTENYAEDFEVFRRTELVSSFITKYGYDIDEAARFCAKRFEENGDLLLIVNTKKQAREMYLRLKEELGEKAYIIHLSTNMCPAHRKESIDDLKEKLEHGVHVVCVTTQLIEAGVDISFRCVVRALAGLDNAAQAAGRCNRNGEKGKICPVYIINFRDEARGGLAEIKKSQNISRNIIRNNEKADLLSVDIQSRYFEQLFSDNKVILDYPANGTTLLELLSTNKNKAEGRKHKYPMFLQSFKKAGTLFEVIDSHTESVIVPYDDEAESLISRLDDDLTPKEAAEILRKAQKYIVSVYMGTKKALEEKGAIHITKNNNIIVLDKRFYNSEFGITTEGAERETLMY